MPNGVLCEVCSHIIMGARTNPLWWMVVSYPYCFFPKYVFWSSVLKLHFLIPHYLFIHWNDFVNLIIVLMSWEQICFVFVFIFVFVINISLLIIMFMFQWLDLYLRIKYNFSLLKSSKSLCLTWLVKSSQIYFRPHGTERSRFILQCFFFSLPEKLLVRLRFQF